jgi:hypothetical protein
VVTRFSRIVALEAVLFVLLRLNKRRRPSAGSVRVESDLKGTFKLSPHGRRRLHVLVWFMCAATRDRVK